MFQKSKAMRALMILSAILASIPTAAVGAEALININTADVEQLMLLPKVGPSVAQRIVDFRESNGRFKALEDLMLVKGIGERTFELLKPHIAIAGDTTLREKVRVPKQSEKS